MSIEEMELFEYECKLLCYKGNMSRSNLGGFYNNEQTNWMYQMWLSSKNRDGYKLVPVDATKDIVKKLESMASSKPAYDGEDIYKVAIGEADYYWKTGVKPMKGVV